MSLLSAKSTHKLSKKELQAMTVCNLIAEWLEYQQKRQSLRPKTIYSYHAHLLRFAAAHPDLRLSGVTSRLCRLWIAGETARSKHVGNSALAALRNWFRYLIAEGYFASDPTVTIEHCKAAKSDRQAAPELDIMALFAALEGCQEGRQLEYRAKLSLLVYGGLRVSEVVQFRLKDINRETGGLTIPDGKGGKSRKIYPAPECIAAVCAWGEGKEPSAKFPGCDVAIRGWLARLCLKANVRVVTPHQLRHSCASRLLKNGATIVEVQHFMGHSDISTTGLYLHTTDDAQRNLAEKSRLNYDPAVKVEKKRKEYTVEDMTRRANWRRS